MAYKRSYEKSHNWLTFSLDLRNASPQLWMLLGAAQSKCRHLAGVPLLPDVAQEMHRVFLAKGALATTAIEGNTLEERDVLALLEGKLALPRSQEYLGREVANIVSACNQIGDGVLLPQSAPLDAQEIRGYNAQILRDIPQNDGTPPGEFRSHSVVVGGGIYRGAPAEDCPYLVDRLCLWLRELTDPETPILGKEFPVASGILAAVLAHLYLVWIHPFGDGNGRTARILEFRLLLEAGAPTPAAHLLSNHYNKTRSEYYRYLHESTAPGGVLHFMEYALQGLVDELDAQIVFVRWQEVKVLWEHIVQRAFSGKTTPASQRRHSLVLALSAAGKPVEIKAIRKLSPEIAVAYHHKTDKTLSRDINALIDRGLVLRSGATVWADIAQTFTLLPRHRREVKEFFLPKEATAPD